MLSFGSFGIPAYLLYFFVVYLPVLLCHLKKRSKFVCLLLLFIVVASFDFCSVIRALSITLSSFPAYLMTHDLSLLGG